MTDKALVSSDYTATAAAIMQDFSRLTGLDPRAEHPHRYLWTDAFAVCNFLELWERTRDPSYRDLAISLIDQVHLVLGRHRDNDPRSGWISGLDEAAGRLHPTIGGLRIGKPLNERRRGELPDERLEWDQDGQYFHYLTKWMHALCQTTRITRDPVYSRWAAELAATAHSRFVTGHGPRRRINWKMSIDLSRPLVSSMGMHDPLDGLVTFLEIILTLERSGEPGFPDLSAGISDMISLCRGRGWETDDPLGIGGLLSDGWRLVQILEESEYSCQWLLESVVSSARTGMELYLGSAQFRAPARYRLAFRELGLSIGLKAANLLANKIDDAAGRFGDARILARNTRSLMSHVPIAEDIEQFWLNERNQEQETWKEHKEINMVMLATSLVPGVFLTVLSRG